MIKLISILFFVVIFSGCTITAHHLDSDAKKFEPTNPKAVKVYSNDEVKENYVVIGSVASHVVGDGEKAVKALKKEASKIGADAIIRFNLDKLNSFSQVTEASGVAVKIR